MERHSRPTVMVLDGDNDNAIQVARELSADLDARVVGVGTSTWSRLLRSRHCDVGVTTARASDPRYPRQLLDAVNDHEPDLLVPVGYHSVAAADRVRDRFPESVSCWLPPSESLDVAVDKCATADLAADLGVDTPSEFTATVSDLDERGRPGSIDDLPFPVFVKARHEMGKNVTARVDDPDAFWETYDEVVAEADGDAVVQEYVERDATYGCGLLYEDGEPRLLFTHEEVRSVPRRGGSGTRVRIFRDSRVETAAIRLLDRLDWHGPALVEFGRRADGSFVLLEVNPKLWASYALASRSGYRFVSTMAARALDLPDPCLDTDPARTGEMVFPLRELYFAARTEGESLLRSAAAMCWPPAPMDVDVRDAGAWFTPPAAVVDLLPSSPGGTTGRPPSHDRRSGPGVLAVGDVRSNGSEPPADATDDYPRISW